MNTNYTIRFNNQEDYQTYKKTITYTLYNDKLKELYISNREKYNEILEKAYHLPASFIINGIQKIDDLSSLLFIIKKDEELSYKTIEFSAPSIDQYEINEEEALMHLIDLPFIIYQ